ncbi:meteorin-like protein [Metopolophium dirhodum]|uniref:meteorin-like protein n=1 Tax=Metopolophium dirhodum TaxID=44670 RepID=UPI0029907528|nr:meteorin-like protein [Metopolophium dirhodum]
MTTAAISRLRPDGGGVAGRPSRRPRYVVEANTTVLLLVPLLMLALATASRAADSCDWSGSGLTSDSSEHSVRPVRLDRCWAGTVRWSYPRGALRVVFRLTGTSGGREFRVCLKPDRLDGVRVLLDSAPRRLIAVYDYRKAGEPLRSRCFKSVGGTAAFYVEADKTGDRSGPVRFRYDLEPLAEPAPQLFVADNLDDECRPCTVEEMTQAYCTSSLVVQGTIVGVSYDGDVSRVRVMPTKAHRLPPEEDDQVQVSQPQQQQEDESGRPRRDDRRTMTITFGRGCRPAAGPGEFVFMARTKFDELALRCAPRLEEWRQAVKADKAPGCILAG